MEPVAIIGVTCIVILLSILVSNSWRMRLQGFPPGPLSLPIIGGLYRLGTDPYAAGLKLWREFGPIVGIEFGPYKSVLINDHKLIKTALNNPALQGRPHNPAWRTKFRCHDNGQNYGYGSSEGAIFQENSKFALTTLRRFGFGSKRMETVILKGAAKICDFFDQQNKDTKTGINSHNIFCPYTGYVMWSLLSHRKMPDDQTLSAYLRPLEGINKGHGSAAVASFFPFLIKIAPNWTGWAQFLQSNQEVYDIVEAIIETHRRDPCTIDSDMDFMDVYLEEVERSTDPKSIFYGETGAFNLKSLIVDLFAGGVDTTAVTLAWTLLFLLHYPQVLKKLQSELDTIQLSDDQPWITLECRPKLPYLEAVIRETLRIRTPVAWGIPHRATQDTEIGQYKIPEGITLYANLFGVGQDPMVWGDPDVFRPERFLSPDNTNEVLTNLPEFLPFATGRRVCPGRNVALDVLFLFLGNVLRQFDVQLPPGQVSKPSLTPLPYLIMTPKSFQFIPVRRVPGAGDGTRAV